MNSPVLALQVFEADRRVRTSSGVALHRLRERAEDNAYLSELGLKRGGHGDAVEHRVHRHSHQPLLLLQGEAELFVGEKDLGIHFIQTLRPGLLGFRPE
jgi:hypothetical protein